ncbi:MAG: hypothetical protein DMF93_06945 [Acidobacteria bacterium]|nr:MAG: hypothetical protein DMF93_06945 [Acidobacteriota bacterium]
MRAPRRPWLPSPEPASPLRAARALLRSPAAPARRPGRARHSAATRDNRRRRPLRCRRRRARRKQVDWTTCGCLTSTDEEASRVPADAAAPSA